VVKEWAVGAKVSPICHASLDIEIASLWGGRGAISDTHSQWFEQA
jgi:hypothetical protein